MISLTWLVYRWENLGGLHPRWWQRLLRGGGRALYLVRRFIAGARSVDCSGGTAGAISEPGLWISWDGRCPVQGYGVVDGLFCYYRSRGESWQFHVAANDDELLCADIFIYRRRPYFFPDGGYVGPAVSARCIRRAVKVFREQRRK